LASWLFSIPKAWASATWATNVSISSKATFRSVSSSGIEELVWEELLTLVLLEDDVVDELLVVIEELETDVEVGELEEGKKLLD
jgi:hypothetical protein